MLSERSTAVRCAMLVFMLVLAGLAGELSATITTTGSVDAPYDDTDPWVIDIGDEFIVGFEADGTLSITAGSDVTSNYPTYIGDYAWEAEGTTGTFLLTGLGSTFTVDPAGESEFFVGPFATGYLSLADQAVLSTHDAVIGGSPAEGDSDEVTEVIAGAGHVSVTGGAQWDTGDWGWLTVGAAGFGELSIEGAGSSVTGDTGHIGLVPDAVGQVAVDEAGSWSLTQDLIVGIWGEGSLMISDGGQVQSARSWVGGTDPRLVDLNEPVFEGYGDANGVGSVVVTGAGSQWEAGSNLFVGSWGTGTVRIESGGQVTAQDVYIGGMPIVLEEGQELTEDLVPNGTGTITVTGDGSLLEVVADDSLQVGYSSDGVLDVNEGGQVISSTVIVGGGPTGIGTVTVHDPNSLLASDEMILVGAWGQGSVTVSAGGTIQAQNLMVGGFDGENTGIDPNIQAAFGDPNGTGTILVTGEASLLDVAGAAYVGNYGTGIADVNDGGMVDTSQTALGVAPGSYGEITVDGLGSQWQVSTDPNFDADTGLYSGVMVVGGYGEGLLTVSNGGQVTVDDVVFIGGYPAEELEFDANAVGYDPNGAGTVTVTGTDAALTAGDVQVGVFGQGTLNLQDGGSVTSDDATVGVAPDSVGTVLVGTGSTWENTESMVVGGYGEGTVTVSGGGQVTVGQTLYIGGVDLDDFEFDITYEGDPNGTGTVTVTGSDSLVEASVIGVGAGGDGTLEILNGGQVNSNAGFVGAESGGTGLVTVDGEGSTWQIMGGGDYSDVEAAGDGEVIVSNGGAIVVDESNALLDVAGTLAVGSEGTGNSLTISDGGVVYSDDGIIGGYNPEFDDIADYFAPDANLSDGTGSATVTGADSYWETEDLWVGFSGDGTLTIENGGRVWDLTGIVGSMEGVTGTVEVSGPDAVWSNLQNLTVGAWGTGYLTISDGGYVWSPEVYIGGMPLDVVGEDLDPDFIPTGTGYVTVTGEGSTLEILEPASLYVGYSGAGTLDVNEGGRVESLSAGIGAMPDSTGTATVHDPNSEWVNVASMFVGGYGEGTLTISNSGLVSSEDLYIGGFEPGDFAIDVNEMGYMPDGTGTVTVTGGGSLLDVDSLAVGTTGEGHLNVLAGAQVNSEGAVIGFGPDSNGVTVVDGAGSTWTLYNDIEGDDWSILGVGVYGQGALTISNGGQVTVADAVVGGFVLEDIGAEEYYDLWGDPNGLGLITVTGAGSSLDVTYDLCVGHSGLGVLEIADGGVVTSDDGFIGDEPNSVGIVTVMGEQSQWLISDDLYVGNEGTGSLDVNDGGFVRVNGVLYVGGDEEGSGGIGTLMVNDTGEVIVGQELYVWETGTLGGDGLIIVEQPTTVHNYGTIAPGNDGIGTLDVYGHVVFHEGSILAIQISNEDSDQLEVGDGVTIEGGTVRVESEGTILGEHAYEIIEAGYVDGEFDVLDTALLDFSISDANLTYEESSVWLYLTAASFDDPNIACTYNQRQVAGALQDIGGEGGNDVTDALQDLETPDEVRHAYDQLSGQTRTAVAPMAIAGSSKFLGTVTSRVQTVRTGLVAGAFDSSPVAAAGPDQAVGTSSQDAAARGQTFAVGNGSMVLADRRWGMWGRGYGLFGDRETDGGVPGYAYSIYGGSFGVDYQWTESFLAGLVGGTSRGDADFGGSRDNTDFDAAHIGFYGSLAQGPWAVDSVVTYANLDYETERFVDLLGEKLKGNFDGSEFAAYVEGSRSYDLSPRLRLAPLASLQYTYVSLDSYTETGGVSALSFEDQTHESIRGSLGARLTRRMIESAGDFRADLQLRGRWVHEFGDTQSSVDSSFASDPTVVFNVRDEDISRDSAVLGAGLSAEMSKRTRAYLDYDTRLNSDESVHVLSASLQYRW
ncbi:MAG: autotransporter domain-containing protein [Phycisphaerales bacterium]